MYSGIKVKKSQIAFFAFLFVFMLDSISYGLLSYFSIQIPIGMVGILLSFVLVFFFIFKKGSFLYGRLGVSILLFFPIVLAYVSGRGSAEDIYFWFRALAIFSAGFYFLFFISQVSKNNLNINLYIFLLVFACMLFIFNKQQGENYLRVSDGIVLFSLFVLSLLKDKFVYLFVVAFTCVSLYFIGSRFGLISYSFAVFLLFFLRFSIRKRFFVTVFSLIPAAVLYQWMLYEYVRIDNIHSNRLLRLFFESENDTSLQGRDLLLQKALEVFKNNYFLGDYKYYLDGGGTGGYAHNFISYWAELGVVGILISFIFLYFAIKSLFVSYRKNNYNNQLYSFVFLTSIVLILGMLFAKSYMWTTSYFLSGLFYSFLNMVKIDENHLPPPAPSKP